jgi:hypothetical protein
VLIKAHGARNGAVTALRVLLLLTPSSRGKPGQILTTRSPAPMLND